METAEFVNKMNALMRRIYNMDLDQFKEEFDNALGFETQAQYAESNFDEMRQNFFMWWINLSKNVQVKLAEAMLADL